MSRFVEQPAALVSGGPAWLLSRILPSREVVKVLSRPPPWLDRADVAATVAAIHRVAKELNPPPTALERDTATLVGAVTPESPWTVRRAVDHLQLSVRRVQELALDLGGRRVGRHWLLDEVAVREFARQREGAV